MGNYIFIFLDFLFFIEGRVVHLLFETFYLDKMFQRARITDRLIFKAGD